MTMRILAIVAIGLLSACGTLERRSIAINTGDDKAHVLAMMGAPGDRQFSGDLEVWQYCQTGAGFGYHDFRTIWFRSGRVASVTSYKDHTPATGCSGHFKPIDWSLAPQ